MVIHDHNINMQAPAGGVERSRQQGENPTPTTMPLTMKHAIFGHRIPWRFKPVSRLWLLMRGIIMWLLWIERLDASFNMMFWHHEKMKSCIWIGIVDYGRMAWRKVLAKCKSNPAKINAVKDKFRMQWCRGKLFAEWMEDHPRWIIAGPSIGDRP
jgi:hypothetical protein